MKNKILWIFLANLIFFTALNVPANALTTMGSAGLSVATSTVVVQGKKIGVGTPTPQYTVEIRGDFQTSANVIVPRGGIYSRIVTVNGTVNWSESPYQRVVIGNGGLSVKFSAPPGPCGLLLIIQRTGSGVIAFPDVIWSNPGFQTAPVPSSLNISASAGGTFAAPVYDILGVYYDGVNYYGQINVGFR